MNWELSDVQAGFRKGRGTRDQIANMCWIIKKAREFQKNTSFCFTNYAKAFHCVDQNKLWEILKEMGIPDHLTCLLRNLYAGQEATVRTGHRTMDWFKIGKGVHKAVYYHPAYLTYMQSTSWETLGSKIAADGTCSHEIKRCLLLGRKAMTNLDSILEAEISLCQQRSV